MFRKKKNILLMMIILLVMLLVACGSDNSASTDENLSTVETTSGSADESENDSTDGLADELENESVDESTNEEDSYTIAVEEILASPESFGEEVSVIGTTESLSGFSFALASDDGNSILPIDYRGSQALPDDGAKLKVSGIIVIDCCGNASMLAIAYEVVE